MQEEKVESIQEKKNSVIGTEAPPIIFHYTDKPHDINFLCKLFQHICTYAFRLKNFDSHILTAITASESTKSSEKRKERHQLKKWCRFLIYSHTEITYKSPNDPDPTLFSYFSWLGSISQTSAPSNGICMQSGEDSILVWYWSFEE